jgi:hypothetical protein
MMEWETVPQHWIEDFRQQGEKISPITLLSTNWNVWVYDGKTGKSTVNYYASTNLFASYYDSLIKISDDVLYYQRVTGTLENRDLFTPPLVHVTEIGEWEGYKVLDLTNKHIKHKSIVLRDEKGYYWILYTQYHWSTASDVGDLPSITNLNGRSILGYRTRIPGTGHFYIEHYFTVDPVQGTPVEVDTSSIDEAIKKAVPKGYGVWKGGGLNFKAMTYTQGIWKPGDGNCCPTGGRIDLLLALEQSRLIVTNTHYEPYYDWNYERVIPPTQGQPGN